MDIFHQSFLRNYLIKNYEIFDNFVFFLWKCYSLWWLRPGYVSFAHFLLYLGLWYCIMTVLYFGPVAFIRKFFLYCIVNALA